MKPNDHKQIARRLRMARARLFSSMPAAVKACGWAERTYMGHESGRTRIPSGDLGDYAERYGVTVNWLIFGRELEVPPPDSIPQLASEGFGEVDRSALGEEDGSLSRQAINAFWIVPETAIGGWRSSYAFVRMHADTMFPTLDVGDVGLVDRRDKTVSQPGVFAIVDGRSALTFARLRHASFAGTEQVIIAYDNRSYGEVEVAARDLVIVGRLVRRFVR